MPNGYTIYIENGQITNDKDFLMLCAQRSNDEMLSFLSTKSFTSPSVNRYKKENYNNAKRALEKVVVMSLDEAREDMKDDYDANFSFAKRQIEELKRKDKCYKKIRDEIDKWVPPSTDHAAIKKFALEQIDMCKPSIYEIKYYQQIIDSPFLDDDETVIKYLQKLINVCKKNVEQAKKMYDDEIERVEKRTKFIDDFIESFKQFNEKEGLLTNEKTEYDS